MTHLAHLAHRRSPAQGVNAPAERKQIKRNIHQRKNKKTARPYHKSKTEKRLKANTGVSPLYPIFLFKIIIIRRRLFLAPCGFFFGRKAYIKKVTYNCKNEENHRQYKPTTTKRKTEEKPTCFIKCFKFTAKIFFNYLHHRQHLNIF